MLPRHWCNQSSRTGPTVKASAREVSLEGNLCELPTSAGNEEPGGLGGCSGRTQEAKSGSQLRPVIKRPWRCDSVSPKLAQGCRAGTTSRMLFFLITVHRGQDSLRTQKRQRGRSILPAQTSAFSKLPSQPPWLGPKLLLPSHHLSILRACATMINIYICLIFWLLSVRYLHC